MRMSKAVSVLETVAKFFFFPLCGMIHFREEDGHPTVGIEHLETDLHWMLFPRSVTNPSIVDTAQNYENISKEDILCHPFRFQPLSERKNTLSQVLDKVYYIIMNTHLHFLNFMKMKFRQRPSYRVQF